MKVGVVIPDRGDRPRFLKNCLRMIEAQTKKPDHLIVVDEPSKSKKCDITYRYRKGYTWMSQTDVDCILFMENDDWYSPDYIETMVSEWVRHGKPDIFGTNYTIYYNINIHKWLTMHHKRRSSAMSTLITPRLKIDWCPDHEPYTDIHLWMKCRLQAVTFKPTKHICMGIKHGIGLCGGRGHTTKLERYENSNGLTLLKSTLDPVSFEFYSTYNDPRNS